MVSNRNNNLLKFFVSGRRAKGLHGLTNLAGDVLNRYDLSVQRAFIGLQRRAGPATTQEVRGSYNIRVSALRGKYRVETGERGYATGKRGKDDFLSIWASTRQISLLEFGGRWAGRRSVGATASIGLGETRTYDGAFIATIKGRRAIRVRSWDRATHKRAGRGPVRILRGPSPFEMLSGADGNSRALAARSRLIERFHTTYLTELRRQWRVNGKSNG
ncbi:MULTISPECIES: hypothetical protein [Stenotrophomonas]|uniref:hypothetical protein n=1 Tax=Stenotrophomonas TaxID=40323 RepID=UPI000B641335|nr:MULTISPECIES: hypothetical protein [Stenotrophomonas]SMR69790.1 hypothetical protein SAMN04487863_0632 [Stenotrophomonas sp. yr243]SNT55899.1 hypothetical protein SAMN05518671_3281 [Stenotrophomonas lactitubi]